MANVLKIIKLKKNKRESMKTEDIYKKKKKKHRERGREKLKRSSSSITIQGNRK